MSSHVAGGLVALSNGAFLAWNHNALIQLRSPSGEWGEITELHATFLESATPSRGGALLLASQASSTGDGVTTVVFLVHDSGYITELPRVPDSISSIAFSGGRDWISTEAGIFEMRVDGSIGEQIGTERSTVLLGHRGGRPVICARRDSSMAHFHPPYCHSVDATRWKAVGDWTGDPLACGEFIVESRNDRLTVRAIATGDVLSTRDIPNSAVACGSASDLMVVSHDAIVDVSLPTMLQNWRSRPKTSPVTALARTKDHLIGFSPAGVFETLLATH